MKITRWGRYRNAGTTALVNKNVSDIKPTRYSHPWTTKSSSIICRAKGEDRGSSYNYEIAITLEELLRFMELGVDACAKDKVERAMGMGAVASLRELLAPNDEEEST